MVKVTEAGFKELFETAAAIIEGRASLTPDYSKTPKKYVSWPGESKYSREKIARILKKLKSTNKTNRQIAEEEKVPYRTVTKLSWQLSKKRGIKKRPSGKSVKELSRKTGFFSQQQIDEWINGFSRRIQMKAIELWRNPVVRAHFSSQEEIVDKLKDRLRWYLEIFSPDKKVKGKDLKEKIVRYCRWHLSLGIKDILRRKKRIVQHSIFEQVEGPRGKTDTEFVELLQGRQEQREPSVEELMENFREKGLTENQRILMLARVAGLPMKQIGKILGVTESGVSHIYTKFKPQLGMRQFKATRYPRRR